MKDRFYLLDENRNVVPCDDPLEWAQGMYALDTTTGRTVGRDMVGDIEIITSFLGMNCNFRDDDVPLVFETMAFKPDSSQPDSSLVAARCSTYKDAEAMHRRVVEMVQQKCPTHH